MNPALHPSAQTLLRHAAGLLPPGPKLVVDIHLGDCPHCRALLRQFEAVGGALLEDMAPAQMDPGALEQALARIDGSPLPAAQEPRHGLAPAHAWPPGLVLPAGIALPPRLAACRIDPLRPVAPGVRLGRVHVPDDPQANVLLLRLGPGRTIPDHTHDGIEYTQVISGAFSDAAGRYGPGDLSEADGAVEHAPVVEADAECVCIAAFEGRLRFRGLLGIALRPFI
ncbi:ChrR family anti-sigma-E factor [Xanthobacter sp. AM11]|uniref:ChrR family anti-sigma-E factor n=1 Tax=Xanthobacter sp. AM11 TaxID=3380643 RepID=UPI0039BFE362